ncbi:MAG TPA: ATP synthase F0 subunit B [Nitrospirae bacterium]|nr:ATP synthase subunit b [bacterium BMS3Abin10]GBE39905.1 ATP synthase subunit b [bacterium BMS3Bbin08]HDH50804.1 ATP synthase F0 subunit B [Nitrospirota bacterium]HDK17510.1 ATP synthase F0 subunit B [Nitrospirota bacterium]HDK41287.1 ATP synthase F0 subunit B [Nitrospirota bacterium]
MKRTDQKSRFDRLTVPSKVEEKIKKQKLRDKVSLIIFSLFTALGSLFTASAAFASGGGEEHGFAWTELIAPVINFGVLVAIIIYFGRKPIGEYFKKRTETIEKSLKEAREAKELAQKTFEEVKERLNNTDREMNEILEAARRSGEKEKETIITEGERLKARILEQARSNIEFELQKARESIKSEAALLALELAEKQIKEKLGTKEQGTLIDEYIKKLEGKN